MNDMTRLLGGSILGSILFLGIVAGAESQVIEDCEEPCGIEVTEIAMLGGDDAGVGFVGRPRSVARLSDGRFLLADFHDQDRIKVYAPDGRYERSIGRRGEGPGEFLSVASVSRLPGDTVEAYDSSLQRVVRLTPGFEVAGTQRLEMVGGGMAKTRLAGGWRIMNQMLRTPESAGLPIHAWDRDGAFVRSFGANPPIEDLRNSHLHFRHLAPASDSAVWSAHRIRYVIEEWNVNGTMVREFTREVPWFLPGERGGFVDPESPPNPELGPIHSDRAGLLWVVVQVPSANWEEALEMLPDPYGRPQLVPGNPRQYQDSVIEVINPSTGRVVARTRTDHRIRGFVEDGMVYTYDETESMEPVVRILKLKLAAGTFH
ncbi:MAG: hypothetical protein EA351_15060 [Gemmatimonadales bacterium]|nr:MAG: hypothetical protein EA351_15060 [Gemmatimonadales bacterium]